MESTPKTHTSSSSTLPDTISELPDIVICEILSLLSTKQAMATSILSKRWRYLWTSIKNLHFDCFEGQRHGDSTDFVEFVDRVLCKRTSRKVHKFYMRANYGYQSHVSHRDISDFVEFVDRVMCKRTSRKVHKFYLRANYSYQSHVSRWIREAINCNVEVLDLHVPEAPGYIFICQSLTSLKLFLCGDKIILNCPNSFYLPKLKVLDIYCASFCFVQQLISNCPALEDLILDVKLESRSTFVISAPLKRLKILTTCDELGEDCKLVIEPAQLEFLDIGSEDNVPKYVIKDLASVVEAKLSIGNTGCLDEQGTSMNFEVLSKLTGVESLTLDVQSMIALEYAELDMLPIFNNMTRLELETTSGHGSSMISTFLEACPSLKVLILKMVSSYHIEEPEFHWIKPESVPPSLSLFLEEIEVFHKKGMGEKGFEMMKYLLDNGEVLKKFTIKKWFSTLEENLSFCNTLLELPRASRFCEVILSANDSMTSWSDNWNRS